MGGLSMFDDALWRLLISTFIVAATHTLSPEHWFGFVMLGRTKKWGMSKTLIVAGVAGIGHVGTSITISSLQYGRERPLPITSPRLPR